jgi:hypothetical protein
MKCKEMGNTSQAIDKCKLLDESSPNLKEYMIEFNAAEINQAFHVNPRLPAEDILGGIDSCSSHASRTRVTF